MATLEDHNKPRKFTVIRVIELKNLNFSMSRKLILYLKALRSYISDCNVKPFRSIFNSLRFRQIHLYINL